MEDFNHSNIKLIVFDVDGTLAETDDYYVEKGVGLFRKILPCVKPETAEKIVRQIVMFGEACLHSFYWILDIFHLDGVISWIHSKLSIKNDYKYKEVDGMREALEQLAGKYLLGIISSGGRKSTKAFIDKFRLENLVSHVIAAEDCRFIKPHPMPLRKIAKDAGVSVENCLMVGDTIFDIFCAKHAGTYSAAVKTGFDSPQILSRYHPDLLLDSVKDLPKVMLQQGSEKLN